MMQKTEKSCESRPIPVKIIKGEPIDSIVGQIEAVKIARKFVTLMNYEELAGYFGIKNPRSIILHGPPGVGKTKLARAICHEADAYFVHLNNTSIGSKYINQTAANLERVFQQAEAQIAHYADHESGYSEPNHKSKLILFWDEIDSICTQREGTDNSKEDDKVVNLLCDRLDGFESLNGIYLISATNFYDKIDDAIKSRSLSVEFKPFSQEEIMEFYKRLISSLPVDRYKVNIKDFKELALQSQGFNGRDLEEIVRSTKEQGFFKLLGETDCKIGDKPKIRLTQDDFYKYIDKTRESKKKKKEVGFI